MSGASFDPAPLNAVEKTARHDVMFRSGALLKRNTYLVYWSHFCMSNELKLPPGGTAVVPFRYLVIEGNEIKTRPLAATCFGLSSLDLIMSLPDLEASDKLVLVDLWRLDRLDIVPIFRAKTQTS